MTTQLVMSRHCESLGGLALSVQQTSSEELNPFELEIVSKFDSIIAVLKDLEEQFSQARQEVLRKSSLEGKESGKIFAIKGRVITNKKKYYKSLEGDIQTLAKGFSDQWNKVLRDFTSLRVVSGLEEKTGAELTPDKNVTAFTPILNGHAAEHHGQDIVASSPFVKSVALPSLKRVDNGKKPVCVGLSTPLQRPLFKASSTTEVEIPKKLDFDRATESIPNPMASRLMRREQQKAEVLQIPEDPEGEEISRGTIARVRLGLLNEIRSSEAIQAPKSVRTIKGHGFKITQATPPKEQQLNQSPPEAGDQCPI